MPSFLKLIDNKAGKFARMASNKLLGGYLSRYDRNFKEMNNRIQNLENMIAEDHDRRQADTIKSFRTETRKQI